MNHLVKSRNLGKEQKHSICLRVFDPIDNNKISLAIVINSFSLAIVLVLNKLMNVDQNFYQNIFAHLHFVIYFFLVIFVF